MNKQELLNDLLSKEWCDSLNGEPELQELKWDGGKWYNQNIREVQGETVAVYRNIPFYVVDEELPTEIAYYKDKVPDTITNKEKTFTQKVQDYTKDKFISIEKIEEENKFAIIKKYMDSELNTSEKRFFVKEIDGAINIKEVL